MYIVYQGFSIAVDHSLSIYTDRYTAGPVRWQISFLSVSRRLQLLPPGSSPSLQASDLQDLTGGYVMELLPHSRLQVGVLLSSSAVAGIIL